MLSLLVFSQGTANCFAQDPGPFESQADAAHVASTPTISWNNGLHIRSRNGNTQVEFGGTIQLDGRIFPGPEKPQNLPDFILRRGRIVFLGTTFSRLDFRITVESQKNSPMVLRDAFADIEINKGISIELGKFKSPIGLERMQSPRHLMFTERALVTDLIPDRDIGIMLHGNVLGNKVSYMSGLFRGVPDGASSETSTNHGADGEFRAFLQPFRGRQKSRLAGLGFGIGGSVGKERGTLASFKTAGLERFFVYRGGAIADGERTRISPQADYYWRRLGMIAEYAVSAQDVRLGDVVQRVSNTAWQVLASFVLTGENASFSGITPTHAFDPTNHHWGAFEVAGRLNSLQVDPTAFPVLPDPGIAAQRASGFEGGLNWYPQKYIKIMFNYAQTRFVGGAAYGNRPTENALIMRFQFSYY